MRSRGGKRSARRGARETAPARRVEPIVTLLEGRTLLTPTTIGLSFSAPSLTYGDPEVITATVSSATPGGQTPTGGKVYFIYKGPTNEIPIGDAALVNGKAQLSTTVLPAGLDEIYADYSGAGAFDPSNTKDNPLPMMSTAVSHLDSVRVGAAVAVDDDGNLFVSTRDPTEYLVKERTITGKIILIAGGGTVDSPTYTGPATGVKLGYCAGLAVFGHSLYIADLDHDVIRVVDMTTHQMTTFAGGGPRPDPDNSADYFGPATGAHLSGPRGLAVDGKGDLYIADSGYNVIRMVTGGTILTIAGDGNFGYYGDNGRPTDAKLFYPSAVAVSTPSPFGATSYYIADSGNSVVRQVDDYLGLGNPTITTYAGGGTDFSPLYQGPATNAGLGSPAGLAVDRVGNLYIADSYAAVVRKVDKSGNITLYAGGGTDDSTSYQGPATGVKLGYPIGLALDRAGNLYIADQPDATLREVSTGAFHVFVSPAPLTITADDKTWNVGEFFPGLMASYSGFKNSDSPSDLASLPALSTTAGLLSPPGTYPIAVVGGSSPNYTITHVNGTLTVTGHPLVSHVTFLNTVATFSRRLKKITIPVFLTVPSKKPVTVHYGFVGGTAVFDRSIRPPAKQTLKFKKGQTLLNITFSIIKSKARRPQVTADLRLFSAVNAKLGTVTDIQVILLATGQ